jgi:hypothetical protein
MPQPFNKSTIYQINELTPEPLKNLKFRELFSQKSPRQTWSNQIPYWPCPPNRGLPPRPVFRKLSAHG